MSGDRPPAPRPLLPIDRFLLRVSVGKRVEGSVMSSWLGRLLLFMLAVLRNACAAGRIGGSLEMEIIFDALDPASGAAEASFRPLPLPLPPRSPLLKVLRVGEVGEELALLLDRRRCV